MGNICYCHLHICLPGALGWTKRGHRCGQPEVIFLDYSWNVPNKIWSCACHISDHILKWCQQNLKARSCSFLADSDHLWVLFCILHCWLHLFDFSPLWFFPSSNSNVFSNLRLWLAVSAFLAPALSFPARSWNSIVSTSSKPFRHLQDQKSDSAPGQIQSAGQSASYRGSSPNNNNN